ncbi:peptidase C14 caspase catalytic subunit p20 [Streptomyces sp. NPDC006997]|uniref:peptidase C14 caspase catalytic subunit p20 n=1 Tax=Streptomyces sp. NPDC006997 TaxID=3155356 RepID=UPI0033E65CF4
MRRSEVGDHLSLVKSERRSSSLVGTVAVADYAHPDEDTRQRRRLRNVADVRDRFTDIARTSLGFGESLHLDGEGTDFQQLWETGLEDFLAHGAERKILYWTGHGVHRADHGYFLACSDSWASGEFAPERAVSVTGLVDRILRSDQETDTLLIIDACSSHSQLPAALRHALSLEQASVSRARQTRQAGFAVIGTSGVDVQIPEGRWVRWLEEALAKPDFVAPDHARPFEPSALYLPLPYLRDAVDAEAAASGLDEPEQRPGYTEVRSLPNSFLDNPHFQDSERRVYTPAKLVERKPWAEAEQFGLEEGSHLSRHFAGRHHALGRVVRWMDTHPSGLLVVTGLAGTGKTALLGRLALTSLPEWRETLRSDLAPATLPRAGTVHAALSCRGQSVHSLVTALWGVLSHVEGVGPRPEEPVTPEQCCAAVDTLVSRAGSLNLLFDALDEALPDQAHDIARHLLNPLSALAGVRLVVGTRPQPRRRTTAPTEEESLLDTLNQSVRPVVLGDDDEARRSIAGMALSVLATEGSPYQGRARDDDRDWTARLVASHSHGSFLVARLAATELARRPRVVTEADLSAWTSSGGMDLHRRLSEEVGHLVSQRGAERAHEVLRALAVIQGRGLPPGRVWLSLANALRDTGTPELALGDLQRVCRSAGGGIIASQRAPRGDGTTHTTYQLAHPSYGEFFLTGAGLDTRGAHEKVVTALRAQAGGDWGRADEYTVDYLGAHAAQTGPRELHALFRDVRFLLWTNPDVMLPLAATLARDSDGAALYGRVGRDFRQSSSPLSAEALLSRKALLRATAFVSHRDATYRALAEIDGFLPWQEYWTDMRPDPLEWRRAAPLGGARTLSWRAGTGAAELTPGDTLTAGGRGEVLVLDPESGTRLLTRRTRDATGERGSALTEVREVGAGPHWTTVARDDEAVYFWHSGSRLPDYVYRWGGAVRSLAAAGRASETVVLAADGQRMWMWSWKGGPRRHGTHLTDLRMMDAERLAALRIEPRLFVLVAGDRARLFEVDRRTKGYGGLLSDGTDLGELEAPAVAAAATAEPDPGPAPGRAGRRGWIAVADGRHIHVWSCETDPDAPVAPPTVRRVARLDSSARGLAFGRHGDDLLLAGYEEVAVRIWAVEDPRRQASFQTTAPREKALAFEPGGRGLLAVADGSDIRMIDVVPALASGHGTLRRPGNQHPAVALAGAPDGPPLLCRTWDDQVLVSRPDRGAPASAPVTPLTHRKLVTAVDAVRVADGWTVAAAAERTVRTWHLSEDLSVVEALPDLTLGGDAGERVPSLRLVVDPDGTGPRLYVPDGGRVVHARLPADASHGWRTGEPTWAGLRCCGIDARAMRDGTRWLAADLGDELRLWSHDEGRPREEHHLDAVRPTGLVLGELYDPEDAESFPLLAWADRERGVYVQDCSAGYDAPPRRLPGGTPEKASLVFAGPPERPVLLVCDERAAPRVWDVRTRAWLHGPGVPWRGYAVHATAAAPDPEGLVVALQGNDRCDLIRLPHAFFAGRPSRTHTTSPR